MSEIVIDLANITKRGIVEWRRGRRAILTDDNADPMDIEIFDFESLYRVIISSWPYGRVDIETYLDLPYPDSVKVDNAVSSALRELSEKK